MQLRWKLIVTLPLASAMMFGESLAIATSHQPEARSFIYTGDIVNANCYQAAEIVNRNSRGYTPVATTNAFVPRSQKVVANASPRKKKEILRHCSINPGTTQFALLNDDGNFLKLDENGNIDVMNTITTENSVPGACIKKIRAVVKGTVDGETLIVQSVSKDVGSQP
jgi:hypothetical protein